MDRNDPDLPGTMSEITLALAGHTPGPVPALCLDTGVQAAEYRHLTVVEVDTGAARAHSVRRVERRDAHTLR